MGDLHDRVLFRPYTVVTGTVVHNCTGTQFRLPEELS